MSRRTSREIEVAGEKQKLCPASLKKINSEVGQGEKNEHESNE